MRIAKIILAITALIVIAAAGFVYLAPESALHLLVNAMRTRAGLERKEIRLPDGLRYVYLEGGRGAPLMLLHGFGANKDNFTLVAGLLTKRYPPANLRSRGAVSPAASDPDGPSVQRPSGIGPYRGLEPLIFFTPGTIISTKRDFHFTRKQLFHDLPLRPCII
jgi:hypothetical protein